MKTTAIHIIRFTLFTFLHLLLYLATAVLFGVGDEPTSASSPPPEAASMLPLLAMIGLNSIVIYLLVLNSNKHKRAIVLPLSIILFGIISFMTLNEALFFNDALKGMDNSNMIDIAVWQAVCLLMVSAAAAYTLPYRRTATTVSALRLPVKDYAVPLLQIAFGYMAIYWLFGYFIAWQDAALREFYTGSTDLLGPLDHLKMSLTEEPELLAFQVLRGFFWAYFVWIIVQMTETGTTGKILTSGLACSVLMASALLVENPFMPEAIRMVHLHEVASSNLIFGMLAAWLFLRAQNQDTQETVST